MTARKPKPRKAASRKRSTPTLSQRVADLEETVDVLVAARLDGFYNKLNEQAGRLDAIEKWKLGLENARRTSHENIRQHILREANELRCRIDLLETRGHFRDASHDEPVSNAGEAIGGFRILGELPTQSRWRRFLTFMRSP